MVVDDQQRHSHQRRSFADRQLARLRASAEIHAPRLHRPARRTRRPAPGQVKCRHLCTDSAQRFIVARVGPGGHDGGATNARSPRGRSSRPAASRVPRSMDAVFERWYRILGPRYVDVAVMGVVCVTVLLVSVPLYVALLLVAWRPTIGEYARCVLAYELALGLIAGPGSFCSRGAWAPRRIAGPRGSVRWPMRGLRGRHRSPVSRAGVGSVGGTRMERAPPFNHDDGLAGMPT